MARTKRDEEAKEDDDEEVKKGFKLEPRVAMPFVNGRVRVGFPSMSAYNQAIHNLLDLIPKDAYVAINPHTLVAAVLTKFVVPEAILVVDANGNYEKPQRGVSHARCSSTPQYDSSSDSDVQQASSATRKRTTAKLPSAKAKRSCLRDDTVCAG